MPLRVVCRAQYLTVLVDHMRPEDYDATYLVQTVKGRSNTRQYARVTIQGKRLKVNEKQKDRALEWFAEWAAPIVSAHGAAPRILVPIPSSKTVAQSPPDFQTARIARAIAAQCNPRPIVAPILRFRRPIPSASDEGGSRDPKILYPELVLTAKAPAGTYILVDDVLTKGGHLIAAAWKLADVGMRADLAVCCGCTTHERFNDPFVVPETTLNTTR